MPRHRGSSGATTCSRSRSATSSPPSCRWRRSSRGGWQSGERPASDRRMIRGSALLDHARLELHRAEAVDPAIDVMVADSGDQRPEEHTSELQSLMRISYAVFCLKKTKQLHIHTHNAN